MVEGKRVLITGCGGGQGEAALRLFVERGAIVCGCDVIAGSAESVASDVGGARASGATVDLADAAAATAWVHDSAEWMDGIDVVFNNAGAARFGEIADLSIEDWDSVIANELSLAFYVTRAAWGYLRKSSGVVLTTASTSALLGDADLPSVAHAAAKGGLIAMTRQLAAEGGPWGVRAICISPGYVDSPATRPWVDETRFNDLMAERLLPKPTTVEEVARLAVFLASDEAATISGANIVIDGGFTAGRPARGRR